MGSEQNVMHQAPAYSRQAVYKVTGTLEDLWELKIYQGVVSLANKVYERIPYIITRIKNVKKCNKM